MSFTKPTLSLFAWVVSAALLIAQPGVDWDLTIGGTGWEEGNRIIAAVDGPGYLVAGYCGSEPNSIVSQPNRGIGDFWVVRLSPEGDVLWEKRYGGSMIDRLWWAIPTKEGNYLLIGDSESSETGEHASKGYGGVDFWVVLIDATGNLIWEKTYGGADRDWPFCGVQLDNGDFLIAGESKSVPGEGKTSVNYGDQDIWVIRINGNGDMIWDKSYGGDLEEQCQYIFPTSDGHFFLGGSSRSNLSGSKTDINRGLFDFWLVKIDEEGTQIWDKTYGGTGNETIIAVADGLFDTYWIAGGSSSDISGEKSTNAVGGEDFWIVHIDNQGTLINDIAFGSFGLDKVYAFYQNSMGNIVVGGLSPTTDASLADYDQGNGAHEFWLIFMQPDGTKLWDKKYGGSKSDNLTDFIFIPNDGFVLIGNSASDISGDKTQNNYGGNDIWVVKLLCDFEVSLGDDREVCPGTQVELTASSVNCPSCLFIWQDGSVTDSKLVIVSSELEFYVTGISENACEYRDTVTLMARPAPQNAVFDFTPPSCQGFNNATMQLVSVENGTPPFTLLEDTLGLGNLLVWQRPGPLELHIVDSFGCTLDTIITIPDADPFTVTIGNDTLIWIGDDVQLEIYTNQPVESYAWTDPTLIIPNPMVSPVVATQYVVLVTSTKGCLAQAQRRVSVKTRKEYFAPNIFSPDHDGTNDYFSIYGGRGVASIQNMDIYDRWGNKVYHMPKVWPKDQIEGWNGDVKGAPAPHAVYIWTAELWLVDGSMEIISGDIALIR
jgi:gliding motility-associated-like protein